PDLARILEAIGTVLVPGGLFYTGAWGGVDEEGPVRSARHPRPRFFAFASDRRMREALAERFRVLSFTTVDADGNHFQSFVLEKPGSAACRDASRLVQAVAGRVRHAAGTGTIPLDLRSFVDGEARSAERTMAGRGGCRTRAGGRDYVRGGDGPGDGGAPGRTASGRQTHAARGRDRDAGRRRGEGRSR